MSAEASTPQPEVPRRRLRVVKSNRSQIVLFSVLTLILTAATVWASAAGANAAKNVPMNAAAENIRKTDRRNAHAPARCRYSPATTAPAKPTRQSDASKPGMTLQ